MSLKAIIIFALVAIAVSELTIPLKWDHSDRQLFVQHRSKAYGHAKKGENLYVNKFYVPIRLGDGKYEAKMAVSTTSRYSWVPYSSCADNCWLKGASTPKYDCNDKCSKGTAVLTEFTSVLHLEKGREVKVSKYFDSFDTFRFGHHVSPKTQIALVEKFSVGREDFYQGGVLGLGYFKADAGKTNDYFLGKLKQNGIIQKEEFSYYFSDTSNFLTLGTRDNYLARLGFAKFDAVTVTGKDFWAIDVNSLTSRKHDSATTTDVKLTAPKETKFVFDATAYGLFVGKKQFDTLKATFKTALGAACDQKGDVAKNENLYLECPCTSTVTKLPTLFFKFNGYQKSKESDTVELFPEAYAETIPGKANCIVHIYQLTVEENNIYAGRQFMKYFYTAFDQENKVIRIAKAWHSPDDFLLSNWTTGTVIVIGLIASLLTFIAVHFIFEPHRHFENRKAFVPQQQIIQYVSQQPVQYYSQQPVVYQSQQHPLVSSQILASQPYIQQGGAPIQFTTSNIGGSPQSRVFVQQRQ